MKSSDRSLTAPRQRQIVAEPARNLQRLADRVFSGGRLAAFGQRRPQVGAQCSVFARVLLVRCKQRQAGEQRLHRFLVAASAG